MDTRCSVLELKTLILEAWKGKNYILGVWSDRRDYELQSQASWSFQIFGEKK